MDTIVNYRVNDEKIILTSVDSETGDSTDIELPLDVFKQLVVDGPPTEEKAIRAVLNEIRRIIKQRVLTIEEIDKKLEKIVKKHDDAQKALKGASDKIEVLKWGAYIRSLQAEKAILDTRRHIVKLMYQEEGRLRAELLKLTRKG